MAEAVRRHRKRRPKGSKPQTTTCPSEPGGTAMPVLAATITDQAELRFDSPIVLRVHLDRLRGRRVAVRIEPARKLRTLPENAYYWGVVLTMIAEETGHTPEEVHHSEPIEALRRKLSAPLGWITGSTTDLSTVEFEDYLTRIRAWAATFLGMFIPLPNEGA
jgi:hypothetical protein